MPRDVRQQDRAGLLDRAHLLATDCRADAVAQARAGLFTDEETLSLKGDRLRARYFTRESGGWRLSRALRAAVRWQVADATRTFADGPWDVVLCRNLFIYLQPGRLDAMADEICARLRPGGFLVLGKAERLPASPTLAAVGRCVYRKVHVD